MLFQHAVFHLFEACFQCSPILLFMKIMYSNLIHIVFFIKHEHSPSHRRKVSCLLAELLFPST